MFFIAGISTKENKLDFTQSIVCSSCGSYGRYEAFVRYSYFSFFFIPLLKWNKKYYITSTCCGSVYTLDKDIGRKIERGENITISESDLDPLNVNKTKICSNCKFPIEDGFEYCPKCGKKIN